MSIPILTIHTSKHQKTDINVVLLFYPSLYIHLQRCTVFCRTLLVDGPPERFGLHTLTHLPWCIGKWMNPTILGQQTTTAKQQPRVCLTVRVYLSFLYSISIVWSLYSVLAFVWTKPSKSIKIDLLQLLQRSAQATASKNERERERRTSNDVIVITVSLFFLLSSKAKLVFLSFFSTLDRGRTKPKQFSPWLLVRICGSLYILCRKTLKINTHYKNPPACEPIGWSCKLFPV